METGELYQRTLVNPWLAVHQEVRALGQRELAVSDARPAPELVVPADAERHDPELLSDAGFGDCCEPLTAATGISHGKLC